MSNAVPSFRDVFEGHVRYVWRSLLYFGVAQRDLDDACQEVFVIVHRRLAECTDGENLRAWIYGICWRVAASNRRKAHRRREIPTAEPERDLIEHREPSVLLEERRRLERLENALAQLNEDQRAVFVLYEIEQLTMREVASALECSINTAFSRLYAARRRVASELGIVVPDEVWKR